MPARHKYLYAASVLLALAVAIWAWFPQRVRPRQPSAAPERTVRFERSATGIEFVLANGTIDDKPIPDSVLGGVALLDCDNDGLLDVYFVNGARFPDFRKAASSFFRTVE